MRQSNIDTVVTAVILAGGLGTRLRSSIGETPKPLADIAGRPFIFYVLSYLQRLGIRDVLLAVGYKKEEVEKALGQEAQEMSIRYSREEVPLGTGGALKQALRLVSSDYAVVLNGDTFLKENYAHMIDFARSCGSSITMALKRVADCSRYGLIQEKNGVITGFVERGTSGSGAINVGVYVVKRNLFDGYEVPKSFSLEREFLTPNVAQLRPCGYYTDGYFIDIGVPVDYQRAQSEIPTETASI